MPGCCINCSVHFDLSYVPLSECSILDKPNLRNISNNKCTATVEDFLSGMGAVIR